MNKSDNNDDHKQESKNVGCKWIFMIWIIMSRKGITTHFVGYIIQNAPLCKITDRRTLNHGSLTSETMDVGGHSWNSLV
jgi:hypothetical protein